MEARRSAASSRAPESLVGAVDTALVALAERDSTVTVFSTARLDGFNSSFAAKFPGRFRTGPDASSLMEEAVRHAQEGGTAFALVDASAVGQLSYGSLWTWLGAAKVNVNLVARHRGWSVGGEERAVAGDIGTLRGIPGMTVVVPGDAPTAAEALPVLAQVMGPAYLRITEAPLPRVSDGSLTLGRANERREGSDLTVVAIGSLLSTALEVAEEFTRVGVELRVLDLASVQPADSKALVRAARETGALLTMEEHSTQTGIGSLVATLVAETYPVPVRRIGLPPVTGFSGPVGTLLSRSHAIDEAWELLRLRGKVH